MIAVDSEIGVLGVINKKGSKQDLLFFTRIIRELKKKKISLPCMSQEYSLRSLELAINTCIPILPINLFP